MLDDIECEGTETSIADCPNAGWETHNCGHAEDVGVVCATDEGTRTKILMHFLVIFKL